MKKKSLSVLLALGLFTSCSVSVNNSDNQVIVPGNILKDNTSGVSKLETNVSSISIVDGQTFQLQVTNTSDSVIYSISSFDSDFISVSNTGLVTCRFAEPNRYQTLDNVVTAKKVTITLSSNQDVFTEVQVQVYTQSQLVLLGEYDVDEKLNTVTLLGLKDKDLTSFVVPSTVTSNGIPFPVEHIASNAFSNNIHLESITLPNSILDIGDNVFYNCEKLTTIQSVTSTGNNNLLPTSLLSIGERAFYNCASLSTITLNDSCTIIGRAAFYNCISLSAFELKSGTKYIEDMTFYNCTALNDFKMVDTVKEIRYAAFKGCINLNKINNNSTFDIMNTETIGGFAFAETGFTSFKIGPALRSIEQTAFIDASEREYIVDENNAMFRRGTGNILQSLDRTIVYFFGHNLNTWGSDSWGTVTEVKAYALYNHNYTPLSTTSSAFSSLANIKTIGDYAFANNNMYIFGGSSNNKLEKIGKGAFMNNSNMSIGTLGSNMTEISDYAFQGCSRLTTLYNFKNSKVTSIGKYAFAGCTSLTTAVSPLPTTVESIGYGAFLNCTSLENIVIPQSTTKVGDLAFYGCNKLTINLANETQADTFDSNWNIDNRPIKY